MSARVRGQRRSRLRRILRGMRLNFITLGLLIVLTVLAAFFPFDASLVQHVFV